MQKIFKIFRNPSFLKRGDILRNIIFAIAAGLVFAFALPPKLLGGLEFIALLPLFSILVLKNCKPKTCFWLGWLAGTIVFTIYVWWYFDALPLNWLELKTTPVLVGAVGLAVMFSSTYFGAWIGLFLFLAKKAFSRGLTFFTISVMTTWPVFEYLRTLLSGYHPFFFGAGTIHGDHFSFGLLGYMLAENAPLRALAPFLGAYGLSVMVLIPNLILFFVAVAAISAIKRKRFLFIGEYAFTTISAVKISTILLLSFLILFASGAYLSKHIPKTDRVVSVAIIQTLFSTADENFSDPKLVKLRLGRAHDLARQALEQSSQIIVMPENAPSIFEIQDASPYPTLQDITSKLGTATYRIMIDTAFPPKKWDSRHNSTALIDNENGGIGVYQKRFLMPWGEYAPYLTQLAGGFSGYNFYNNLYPFVPGGTAYVFDTKIGRIGLATCSELLSAQITRGIGRQKPDIIIVSASLGLVHNNRRVDAQNLAMAQIRAAELRKPIIYAVNEGRSFAVDAKGEIIWRSEKVGEEIKILKIETNSTVSPAAYYLP